MLNLPTAQHYFTISLTFVFSDELRERHQGAQCRVPGEAAGGAHPARGRGEAARQAEWAQESHGAQHRQPRGGRRGEAGEQRSEILIGSLINSSNFIT